MISSADDASSSVPLTMHSDRRMNPIVERSEVDSNQYKTNNSEVDGVAVMQFQQRSQRLRSQIESASVRAHLSQNKGSLKESDKHTNVLAKDDIEALARDIQAAGEKQALETDVHFIKMEKLLDRLRTGAQRGLQGNRKPDNLSIGQVVAKARAEHGSNQLTPPKSKSLIWLFLEQFIAGFSVILWVAALVILLCYEPLGSLNGATPQMVNVFVAIVIAIVIAVSALFNFYQEYRSMAIIKAFSHIIPRTARVIRDGNERVIPADELVVGDIVKVGLGDKIPADLRMLATSDLQVNNSALTGESEPVTLGTACTSLNYLESTNIAFYSALVVQGSGQGIVVSVGDNTTLGQVSRLTQSNDSADTSLHQEIRRFVLMITVYALTAAAISSIMWAAYLYPEYPSYMPPAAFGVNLISLIVAFTPEGLPICVTLTLTLIATRMMKQRVLVKNLAIIETFSSVSTICSDKTGTLTQNLMTVMGIFWGTKEWKPSAANVDGAVTAAQAWNALPAECKSDAIFTDIIDGMCLCNNAEQQTISQTIIDPTTGREVVNDEPPALVGDAVDCAFYKLLRDKLAITVQSRRVLTPRYRALPFNSRNKLMITMNERADGSAVCYMKGAPEIIMQYCSHVMDESHIGTGLGVRVALTAEIQNALAQKQESMGNFGYRVLGIARRELAANDGWKGLSDAQMGPTEFNHLPASGYTLLGMIALIDPPREDAAESVDKCRVAGIRTMMLTGDHISTATAISKQVHIITPANAQRVRTFRLVEDEVHRPTMQIVEADKIIESHVIGTHPAHSTLQIPSALQKAAVNAKVSGTKDHSNSSVDLTIWQKKRRAWQQAFGVTAAVSIGDKRRPELWDAALVVTGSQLKFFDDYLWSYALMHNELVFSRTSPEQKLRIVSELQSRHEVCAVTGDGVNDAPALKASDCGCAMGSGAQVAIESADLILLDNNFSSVVRAIEIGRMASVNLKKVIVFLLPGGSFSEFWPVFFNVFLGVPLSLSTFQMIIICVLTDVASALSLVREKPEKSLMLAKPVDRRFDHLVDWKLIFHGYMEKGMWVSLSAWFCFFNYFGEMRIPISRAFMAWTWLGESCCAENDDICLADDAGNCYQTDGRIFSNEEATEIMLVGQSIFFVAIVVTNFFSLLSTRTRTQSILQHNPFWGQARNLSIPLAMLTAALIAILVTQVPFFQEVFFTRAVPVKYVAPSIGFGVGLLLYDELRKWNLRNRPDSLWAKTAW